MSIAFVQQNHVDNNSGGNAYLSLAFSSPVTAGNLLLAYGILGPSYLGPTSVVDTQGNVWSAVPGAAVYWTIAGASGANTVHLYASGNTSGNDTAIIAEYSGASNVSSSTTMSAAAYTYALSGAMTVANPPSGIVMFLGTFSGGAYTPTDTTNWNSRFGPGQRSTLSDRLGVLSSYTEAGTTNANSYGCNLYAVVIDNAGPPPPPSSAQSSVQTFWMG